MDNKAKAQPAKQGCCAVPPVRWRLYCTYTLSAWGDRMWHFAVGMLFVKIYKDSLLLTAIYSLTSGINVIIFGPHIGAWVDRTPRLKAVRTSLVVQNLFAVSSAAVFCVILWCEVDLVHEPWRYVVDAVAILLSLVSITASTAYQIAIQKDWVVVIASGDSGGLADMNACMRTIDLMCKLLAPTLVGQVMTFSLLASALLLGAWNVISVFLEYGLLLHIYKMAPNLAVKSSAQGGRLLRDGDHKQDPKRRGCFGKCCWQWCAYFRHAVFPAGLALALLYFTALDFGSVSLGYFHKQGLSLGVVGGISGMSGLLGVCGSLLYPRLIRLLGLRGTGLVGFVTCFLCMMFCLLSIMAPGSPFLRDTVTDCTESSKDQAFANTTMVPYPNLTTLTARNSSHQNSKVEQLPLTENVSLWLLLVGMVSARIGLWLADLSVNQFLQEMVDESERGVIGGVQYSMNRVFAVLINGLIIGLPHVRTFGFVIIASVLAWDIACFIYVGFACWHKRHGPVPVTLVREPVLLRHHPPHSDDEQKRRSQAEEFRKSLLQDDVDLNTTETPV